MAGERDLFWGADATDAQFRTGDDQPSDRFVLLEDTDAGTILLEYDDAAGEYVYRGPVNMDGNALSGVSDLTVNSSITDPTGTTYTDLAAIAGIKSVQTTAPSSPAQGDTWGNPDTGVVKWWDGEAWVSDPPDVLKEAVTFAESDVSIANGVSLSGSIVMGGPIDDFESGDLIVEDDGWQDWSGETSALSAQQTNVLVGSWSGLLESSNASPAVTLNRNQTADINQFAIDFELDNQTGDGTDAFSVRIAGANGNYGIVANAAGDGQFQTQPFSWSANTHYRLIFTNIDYENQTYDIELYDVDSDSSQTDSGVSFNQSIGTFSHIELVNVTNSSGQTVNAYIDSPTVTREQTFQTQSNPIVSWTSGMPPADLAAWDAVWYQRTLDGETVTVDVLDGTDTVLDDPDGNPLTDVPNGVDISHIDPSTEIRVRANLSRADTANDPSFDSVTVTGVR